MAIARLQSAGVPVMPLLKRVGLPPESASAQKTPTIIRIGASSSTPGGEKLASVGFAEHLAFSTKFWMSLTFGEVRFESIWTVDDPDELIVRRA
jgi:hypothetical protein